VERPTRRRGAPRASARGRPRSGARASRRWTTAARFGCAPEPARNVRLRAVRSADHLHEVGLFDLAGQSSNPSSMLPELAYGLRRLADPTVFGVAGPGGCSWPFEAGADGVLRARAPAGCPPLTYRVHNPIANSLAQRAGTQLQAIGLRRHRLGCAVGCRVGVGTAIEPLRGIPALVDEHDWRELDRSGSRVAPASHARVS
jgi:hypothetical protein